MIRTLLLATVVASCAFFVDVAPAAQYQSGGNVVHTRLAPVVVHRVFPPYWGVHRYERGGGGFRRGR